MHLFRLNTTKANTIANDADLMMLKSAEKDREKNVCNFSNLISLKRSCSFVQKPESILEALAPPSRRFLFTRETKDSLGWIELKQFVSLHSRCVLQLINVLEKKSNFIYMSCTLSSRQKKETSLITSVLKVFFIEKKLFSLIFFVVLKFRNNFISDNLRIQFRFYFPKFQQKCWSNMQLHKKSAEAKLQKLEFSFDLVALLKDCYGITLKA